MDYIILLHFCLVLIVIMLFWFDADTFEHYFKLFRLNKIFDAKWFVEYEKMKEVAPNLHITQFLKQKYSKNFFIQLICCRYCLCAWMSILVGAIMLNPLFVLYAFITTSALYKLVKN